MDDLTSDLRYILITGRDNNGMNLMDGTIEDLEFWNGGQQGDVTFEDNFKLKTATLTDDFASYADQTEADASWAPVGTTVRVNPTTDVMDWDFDKVGGNRASAFDLNSLGITASDTQWTLRWKHTYDTVGDTSSSANIGNIGLYDSDETVASSSTQDFITFKFFKGTNTTTTNFIGLQSGDGIIVNDGAGDSAFANQKNPVASTTLFFELKRTSATTYEGNIYSDANYSILVDSLQETVASSTINLRYIKIQNDDRVAVGGGSFNGTLDDIEFYNGNSTLTDWSGSGTDIVVNTSTSIIDWDANDVSTNHAVSHDLQSSIGVNADNERWTLRAKLTVNNVVAGGSPNTVRVYLGLFDSDHTADSNTTQDGLFLGLQRGSVANQIGIFESNGAVLDNLAVTTFSTPITATTYFVEIKRITSTSVRISLFSDADYSILIESKLNFLIDSGIVGLRYIKVINRSTSTGDSTLDGTIDDIEFYNAVSVSKTPVSETKDFEDTFLADNWADQGTGVEVNTGTQVIDWTSILDSVARATVFDLGAGNVSDTEWALRFKYRTDTLTAGSTRTKYFWIGLFDSDQTVDSESVQDFIGFEFFVNSTLSVGRFSLSEKNNVILTGAGTQADLTTTPSAQLGNDLYVEVRRLTSTRAICSLYSDPDYSILIERVSLTVPAGIIDLRYIGLKNRTDPVNTGSMTGIVDDVQFWNKQNALDHQNKWRKIDL